MFTKLNESKIIIKNTKDHHDSGTYEFNKMVLNLNLSAIDEPLNLEKLPSRDYSISPYYDKFKSHIDEEVRAIIQKGFKDIESQKILPFDAILNKVSVAKNKGNPSTLFVTGIIPKDQDLGSYSSIAVLVINKNKLKIGIASIDLKDKRKISIKIILEENDNSFSVGEKNQQTKLSIYAITSLVNYQRMYDVCTEQPKPDFLNKMIQGKSSSWEEDEITEENELSNLFFKLNINNNKQKKKYKFTNSTLDESQLNAVNLFINKEKGLYLLQGPPGTGKTTTIVELLYASYKTGNRILVCAPSNKAIQVIAERFHKKFPEIFIVLAGVEEKLSEDLREIFLHTWYDDIIAGIKKNYTKKIGSIKEMEELIALFENTIVQLDEAVQIFESKIPKVFSEISNNYKQQYKLLLNSYEDTKNYKNTAQKFMNIFSIFDELDPQKIELELLNKSTIIFCTLSVSGRSILKQMNNVDILVVDEAGQSVEAETLIPFMHHPKKCLLVGDTKQLPATVISPEAEKYGFSRSLMWRLQEECEQPYIMLNVQYRMHKEIREWPSKIYYDNKIKDGKNITEREDVIENIKSPLLKPYSFINVSSKETKKGHSFINKIEAELVINLIAYLRFAKKLDEKITIGVITFYSEQVKLIKKILENRNITNVSVNSVDGFQGDECDIVVVSFVRSNSDGNVGFLKDFRRLNVAVTRAKFSLILFGNEETLTQDEDSDLFQLIKNVKNRKVLFSDKELNKLIEPKNSNKKNFSETSNSHMFKKSNPKNFSKKEEYQNRNFQKKN